MMVGYLYSNSYCYDGSVAYLYNNSNSYDDRVLVQ